MHLRSYLDLPINKHALKPDIMLTFSENKWHLEFEWEKKTRVTYIKMNRRWPQTRYLILRQHEGKAKSKWMSSLVFPGEKIATSFQMQNFFFEIYTAGETPTVVRYIENRENCTRTTAQRFKGQNSDIMSNAKLWSFCRWFLVIQTLIWIGQAQQNNEIFKL